MSLAVRLSAGAGEAEWRTAVGRAYYAAFHAARELLEDLGFTVPRADVAHFFLSVRLQNSGDPQMIKAGSDLNTLRRFRNQADYDLYRPFSQRIALSQVPAAERIIQALNAAQIDPLRTQITDAMKSYERSVNQVTWKP